MNSFAPRLRTTNHAKIWSMLVQTLLIVKLTLLMVLPLQAQENGAKRIALVIGNSAYENVAELKNPGNDSADLAAALTAVGFEVILHTDQTQGAMLDTLRGFRRSADGAEVALIYFAGHGIEIDRQNYLLPVDAVLETDADVNFEAVKLETMIFATSGAKRLGMVIVDACRNNPFATSMKRSNSSRSIGHGLSAVEPAKNTLVAYAAKEGTTAADGAGRNSPYAKALIASLRQPDLEVGLMMRRVRDDVLASTGGKQEPFVYGALSAEQIFLNDTRDLSPIAPAILVTNGDVEDVPDASADEIVFWQSIVGSSETSELEAYLARYPDGFFVDLARARIKKSGKVVPGLEGPTNPLSPDKIAPQGDIERELTRREMVELQERLSAVGHRLGPADGIAGRRTEAAIRDYEKAQNLPILGQATWAILSALREQVRESELKTWRSKQTAAGPRTKSAPTQTKATSRSNAVSPPKAVSPAKVAAPKPKTETISKPLAKYKQFCGSNRQCGNSQCRIGTSGETWRKSRECRFCALYAQRCG